VHYIVIRVVRYSQSCDPENQGHHGERWRMTTYIYIHGGAIFLRDVHCPVSQDPGRKVIVVVGMEGGRDKGGKPSEQLLCGSRVGTGFKYRGPSQLRHSLM
jgi:hypothetical protein